jgi:hemin uptake protein HemP
MKAQLQKRLKLLTAEPEVVIRWNGQEITVKLPKAG